MRRALEGRIRGACLSQLEELNVAIEFTATGRRDLRSHPEELFLFIFMRKRKNYFEIANHKKSGVLL